MRKYIQETIKSNPGVSDITLAKLTGMTRKDLNHFCEDLGLCRSVISSANGLIVLYYPDARTREQVRPSHCAEVPRYENKKTDIKPYSPPAIVAYQQGETMSIKITPETIKADIERYVQENSGDIIELFDFLSDLMLDIGAIINYRNQKKPEAAKKKEKSPSPKIAKKVMSTLEVMIDRVQRGEISQVKAAVELGISRSYFRKKLEEHKNAKTKKPA